MNSFANLPKSAMENLIGLGKKMEEVEKEIREMLNISENDKLSITHQWDGAVVVWVNGFCKGRFETKARVK